MKKFLFVICVFVITACNNVQKTETFTEHYTSKDDVAVYTFTKSVREYEEYPADEWGKMSVAISRGDIKEVKRLLKEGFNVNNTDHGSALTDACLKKQAEIAKILIAAGADVNKEDTLRAVVKSYDADADIVKILIDSGAKVNTFIRVCGRIEDAPIVFDNGGYAGHPACVWRKQSLLHEILAQKEAKKEEIASIEKEIEEYDEEDTSYRTSYRIAKEILYYNLTEAIDREKQLAEIVKLLKQAGAKDINKKENN